MKTESYISLGADAVVILAAILFALRLRYRLSKTAIVPDKAEPTDLERARQMWQEIAAHEREKPRVKFAARYSGKRRFTKAPKS